MSQLSAFLEAHPGWEPIESESEDDDDDDEEDDSEGKSDGRFINFGFVYRFVHSISLRNSHQARINLPVIPKKRKQRKLYTKQKWKMMNIKQKSRHTIVLLILFMK